MSKDIHKWTTGRYILMFDEHTFFVWDNEKDRRMTALQVTEKLNELSYENDILNKNEDDLEECTIENIKLKEENEQLRQKLDFYLLDEFEWKEKYGD